MHDQNGNDDFCPIPQPADLSGIEQVRLDPAPPLGDYRAAMALANREAERRLGETMLLSWYDRDRDFESPQHSSECHQASAIPGYVDYGIHHGARLMVDIHEGRFVFFYLPLEGL
jgi:hypothetical protein